MRVLLIASSLVFASLAACVSGGDAGRSSVALGGLYLMSAVAQDAKSGKQGAKALWCQTLVLVDQRLAVAGHAGETLDETTSALERDIAASGRQAGYLLHHLQVRELVQDARAVCADKDTLQDEKRACR